MRLRQQLILKRNGRRAPHVRQLNAGVYQFVGPDPHEARRGAWAETYADEAP
jgi:hypothetical protein